MLGESLFGALVDWEGAGAVLVRLNGCRHSVGSALPDGKALSARAARVSAAVRAI